MGMEMFLKGMGFYGSEQLFQEFVITDKEAPS